MRENNPLLATERANFHARLINCGVLSVNAEGVASNADAKSRKSRYLASSIARQLRAEVGDRLVGQSSGSSFEAEVTLFIKETFPKMQSLRPGKWEVIKLGNRSSRKLWSYAQYEHLEYLDELAKENRRLSVILGRDYLVAPDIVVYRNLYSDEEINNPIQLVDERVATHADLRDGPSKRPILHASISTKWTIRSDRSQNSRTEALNLIRNRKGTLPHMVVVTGDPLPSRLRSIALGTGDIDCVYHFALPELEVAALEFGDATTMRELGELIEGKRIKDVSDLPLDLCV